jgi:flagellar hook-associated protein 1 FlgK
VTVLPDSALRGGELGGLMEFRSTTLDTAQNALGRIAIGLAASFNDQHRLGQDSAGNMGGDLFKVAAPDVSANQNTNAPDPLLPTTLVATMSDASQLSTSDYSVSYDEGSARFTVTRLSDNVPTTLPAYTQPGPQTLTLDGVDFTLSGKPVAGDKFTVRPTANGAAQFSLLKHETGDIAAAGPIMTGAVPGNKGNVVISEGRVDKNFLPASSFTPATITFNGATNVLSGFTAGQTVTVTTSAGTQSYVAGTDPVPFVSGASYNFGGITLSLKGLPADGDKFTVARNTGAASDNRNLLLLGDLQSKPILGKNSTTFQGAFAQLVSTVGNKAREVQVNGQASEAVLAEVTNSQQSVSGVNLDEEAANLLKYQQAYQAAGKVMQIASSLFDTLLSLGR